MIDVKTQKSVKRWLNRLLRDIEILQQKYRYLHIARRSYSKNTGIYILPGDPTAKIQVEIYCQEIIQQKCKYFYIARRSYSKNTGRNILSGDPTAKIRVEIYCQEILQQKYR